MQFFSRLRLTKKLDKCMLNRLVAVNNLNKLRMKTKVLHDFPFFQPRNDMLPCMDVIKEYLGIIFTFPDMVQIHRGASSKVHDCDKMKEEGRIDVS